ncbi:hypothetical protein ILUMI_02007 [Ignelater luminosus]|uniref:Polyprotein n=1 Tax=Ignelater luminosus TaxID=2038154 RepID=A0A8K0GNM3_IGNLU|nr:hypothetical protein ILUMI_02007 [Ignelater luminosus]
MKKKEGETADEKTGRENKLAQLEKKDRKCKSQIIQRMEDSHLEHAKGKENSYELWSSLCNVSEREGTANDKLTNHFLKFDKSIRDLRPTGATLEETDIVCHLLLTMPNECGLIGHKKVDCRTKSENFRKNVSNKANIASKPFDNLCRDEEESKNSRATEHLVCTNVLLSNVRKLKTPIRISVAKSGTHIEVNKVGDFDIATKRQTSVAVSSTEFEYIALAMALSDLLWLKKLLEDFGILLSIPLKVFEDNQSCIHLLHKWEHRRLKHVDVKYNCVRDLIGKGIVDVKYICTSEQVADISLSSEQSLKLRLRLGLIKVKGINTALEEEC